MYYVIQENLFREYGYKALIQTLERGELEYEIVKYIPFSSDIDVKTERKDVFFFGSINGGKVAEAMGWDPGHLINKNFDMEVYAPRYGDHMLNKGWIQNISWPLPEQLPDEFFARPTKDTKQFSGQVFSRASWADWTRDLKDTNLMQDVSEETRVFVAPIKEYIQQEIRCWIVDRKLVSASQYKIGRRVNYLNMDNNEEVTIFSEKIAKIFSPAKAWVLDICLWQDEYYVVEMGCINHCGFYDCNMSKLIQSLEKAFGNKDSCYDTI